MICHEAFSRSQRQNHRMKAVKPREKHLEKAIFNADLCTKQSISGGKIADITAPIGKL